ncbi:polysaccharide pyruvyl transferase CsaB [Halobacillus aidingensis]|uniref:Polysaccharide pyruvyl transferase CsaB n=1 Tax=Halobacillus aidingensis TaxID=240303 RepID=A0A1H0KNZ2_HALAD|nr:polysaccharide pyruvyl transferase CsaB [Halobacillus aidingensis]SDO57513.1 polysaccharide pyruvyl transferase CsaB [Halobacillus aidingensis]
MKVVLSGYYGFDNTGDEAILKSMIQHLKAIEPGIQIIVLSQSPSKTESDYGVSAVNRWDYKAIIRILKESDGLISGGGSLLQDATGPRSVLYYTGIMHMAKWLRKPVFIYAQGMGPIRKPFHRLLVRIALNGVTGISVRDMKSKEFLERIGVRKSIHLFPDPVFGYDYKDMEEDRNSQKPLIAVSIREWGGSDKLVEKLTEAFTGCIEKGYRLRFIPMHGESDEAFSNKVAQRLNQDVEVVSGHMSIDEKLHLLSEADVLIGMRLHSLIFAGVCSVPFVALSYDPKIDALADQLDFPVTVDVNDPGWESSAITKEVERLYEDLPAHKEKLEHTVSTLSRRAKETARAALHHIQQKK